MNTDTALLETSRWQREAVARCDYLNYPTAPEHTARANHLRAWAERQRGISGWNPAEMLDAYEAAAADVIEEAEWHEGEAADMLTARRVA